MKDNQLSRDLIPNGAAGSGAAPFLLAPPVNPPRTLFRCQKRDLFKDLSFDTKKTKALIFFSLGAYSVRGVTHRRIAKRPAGGLSVCGLHVSPHRKGLSLLCPPAAAPFIVLPPVPKEGHQVCHNIA